METKEEAIKQVRIEIKKDNKLKLKSIEALIQERWECEKTKPMFNNKKEYWNGV